VSSPSACLCRISNVGSDHYDSQICEKKKSVGILITLI